MAEVRFGRVVGRFVSLVGVDEAGTPVEVPMTGRVTLSPLTDQVAVPGAVPPVTAVSQSVICHVVDGVLLGPDGVPGVSVAASSQPDGQPSLVQWQAVLDVGGAQSSFVFEVPDGGVVDLSLVAPVQPAQPASAPVYSRGTPGGVAGIDADGDVINASGAKVGRSVDALTDATTIGKAIVKATDAGTACAAIRALSRDVLVDAASEGVPTDGATSAAGPLNSAQALLPSAGGRLLLRRGSYNMTTRTTITKQGFVLEGEGPDATILNLASAALQVGASDVIIRGMTIRTNTVGTDRQLFNNVTTGAWKNWRFEDCVFDGVQCVVSAIGAYTDAGPTTLTSAAALTDHVEFDRCEFKNTKADGVLQFRGVEFVTVNRCWLHNLGLSTSQGDCLKLTYGTSRFRVTDNDFNDVARDAIDCYDGQQGLIQGNMIKNTGAFGIEIKVTANSATNKADRIQVLGNRLYGTGETAITTASPNVMISNNYLESGSSYGIRSTYKTNASDRNNDVQWLGNRVQGFTTSSRPAFSALGIDGLVVMGNTATDGYQGFIVPLGSAIGQNQYVVGGSSTNSSRNNSIADVWT